METYKISTKLNDLDNMHQSNLWIPNSKQIRPIEEVIQEKNILMKNILIFYESMNDYILDTIFNLPKKFNSKGKLLVDTKNIKPEFKLVKNKFPYDLPIQTEHYILWFNTEVNYLTDIEIKQIIDIEIKKYFKKKKEFVWYENPKMSIPQLYHIQVFIKIK